jgi:orotidine-5'-phosphate decarboxylase
MIFKEKLRHLIRKYQSNLVVGLDTDLNKIPEFFRNERFPLYKFNEMVILATRDNCLGYKINLAFYEANGIEGFKALEKTMKFISGKMLTICDAKRGDIGNTSVQYAKSIFGNLNFDAVTLSPYMGTDSIEPFLTDPNKFAYILVRTSNKSADEIQNIKSDNKRIYEIVAKLVLKRFGNQVGLVIGANHNKDVSKFSSQKEEIPLLIPGIGAQDNNLRKLMKNIKNELFVINASRSVIYAGKRNMSYNEYYDCVRISAQKLNNEINSLKKFAG